MNRVWTAFVAVFLFVLPASAWAQGTPQQCGATTAGHLSMYVGNNSCLSDAGGPTSANGTPPNSTNAGTRPSGVGIVNSGQGIALYSGYSSAAYSKLLMGFDGSGNVLLTVGTVGGTTPTCNWNINGTVTPCVVANGAVPVLQLVSYGAVCDGSTDDSAAFAAAISAMQSTASTHGGGLTLLPPGKTCATASTVAITASGVGFNCGGSGPNLYASGPGCEIKWVGSSGGRIMSIVAPTGVSAHRLAGNIVQNIRFNGNSGLAADGLYLSAVSRGVFANLGFIGDFNGGNVVNVDVPSTVTGFVDTPTSQNNEFSNIGIVSTGGTSNGIRLGAYVDNDGTASNASFNRFTNLFIQSGAGKGILCVGCDNNDFYQSRVYTNSGVPNVDLTIAESQDTTQLFPANGNLFEHIQYDQSFDARGQTSFASCVAFSFGVTPTCSFANELRDLDKTNGSPDPTIEAGAQLVWGDDIGRRYAGYFLGSPSLAQPGLTVVDDLGQSNTCANASRAHGVGVTTYLCNANTTPFLEFDNLNGSRIILQQALTSSSNLTLQALAGTGKFEFAMTPQFDSPPIPSSDLGVSIGLGNQRFLAANVQKLVSDNGAANWITDSGIGASGDGNYTFTHNGTPYLTIGSSGTLTLHDLTMTAIPTSAGAGGLYVCVDTAGVTYKKASCP